METHTGEIMSKLLLLLVLLGGCTTTDWSVNSTKIKVDYRYEVRQINHLLFTCHTHNEAYDYVVKYNSTHSNLVIHDLKTGEIFEETP